MFFRFPPDGRWNPERSAVEFGIGVGDYEGVVRVSRRVFQSLPGMPEPAAARCRYFRVTARPGKHLLAFVSSRHFLEPAHPEQESRVTDFPPKILLCRLFEKNSASGNQYFQGRLGAVKVILPKSRDLSETGEQIWELSLQESAPLPINRHSPDSGAGEAIVLLFGRRRNKRRP
jgi:hypothetical protein